jgi:hypothetical protein
LTNGQTCIASHLSHNANNNATHRAFKMSALLAERERACELLYAQLTRVTRALHNERTQHEDAVAQAVEHERAQNKDAAAQAVEQQTEWERRERVWCTKRAAMARQTSKRDGEWLAKEEEWRCVANDWQEAYERVEAQSTKSTEAAARALARESERAAELAVRCERLGDEVQAVERVANEVQLKMSGERESWLVARRELEACVIANEQAVSAAASLHNRKMTAAKNAAREGARKAAATAARDMARLRDELDSSRRRAARVADTLAKRDADVTRLTNRLAGHERVVAAIHKLSLGGGGNNTGVGNASNAIGGVAAAAADDDDNDDDGADGNEDDVSYDGDDCDTDFPLTQSRPRRDANNLMSLSVMSLPGDGDEVEKENLFHSSQPPITKEASQTQTPPRFGFAAVLSPMIATQMTQSPLLHLSPSQSQTFYERNADARASAISPTPTKSTTTLSTTKALRAPRGTRGMRRAAASGIPMPIPVDHLSPSHDPRGTRRRSKRLSQ